MDLNELKTRRISLISMMPNNSIAILSSANRNYRTRDVENPYRQDSDFLYINGLSRELGPFSQLYGRDSILFLFDCARVNPDCSLMCERSIYK